MTNPQRLPLLCVAGQNAIAVQALEHLHEHYADYPLCVLPCPHDNGEDGWQPSLKRRALQLGVKLVDLETIYADPTLIFFSLQYSQIIHPGRFASTQLFNLHFSKLPQYKGVYPAIHPILRGEKSHGVTLHKIDEGIDTGNIIAQATFNIKLDDTARDLYLKLSQHASRLFKKHVDQLIHNRYSSYEQPAECASYYSKASIDFNHIKLDLNKTAYEIHNQFRAFTFREYQMPVYRNWPIVKSYITFEKRSHKPGTEVEETDEHFTIAGVDFNVRLLKDYYPSLWQSCQTGDKHLFDIALARIDDIDLRNKQGWTALIIASYHGHIELVRALVARGANVNLPNYKGTTPLMYALSGYEMSHNEDVFRYLISCGAKLDSRDQHGKSVEEYLLEKGCQALLKPLKSS